MFDRLAKRLRRPPASGRPRRARPVLDPLEDRFLMYAANGGMWSYTSRITYSFMPDGTNVGGVSSSLFSTLNASYSTAAWELQFQKAAAVWEAVANVNLVQVPDDGSASGVNGNQQGAPNFGDIRIGAVPQSGGTLAVAFLPPPFNGGTAAGDVLLNSNSNWSAGGYDLETVAIHEIGHALGLGHSEIAAADMYAYYNGVKQALTRDDSAGIQSVVGPLPPPGSNSTYSTAQNITANIDGNGQVALSGQTIVGSTNTNWFVVTAPSNTTGTMTVTMQSSNLSSLSPRVVVYNGLLRGLAQASSTNLGDTVSVTIANVTAGQTYFIRALDATTGPGSVGAYGLLVNFGSQTQSPIAPPNTVVAQQPDQGGGSSSDSSLWQILQNLFRYFDSPQSIRIGTLTQWGDTLKVGPDQLRGHLAQSAGGRPGHQEQASPQPVGPTVIMDTRPLRHTLRASAPIVAATGTATNPRRSDRVPPPLVRPSQDTPPRRPGAPPAFPFRNGAHVPRHST